MTRGGRCLLAASAAALACASAPTLAGAAGFAKARTADGPSPDVLALGGVGLARDGGGAVAYLKRAGGQAHVFVSPLVSRRPTAPVRVDTGQLTDSSDVRIAAADRGKVVVAWINSGLLYASVRPSAGSPFGRPEPICVCTAADPSLDVSKFGTAYLTFTTPGGGGHDVRVAEQEGGGWTLLGTPLDIRSGRDARGARVAASSDGTGIAAWTERGSSGPSRVYERRLLHTELSNVPKQASVGSLSGRSGGSADSPALDVQDDSSFAWVTLRQDFDDGGKVRSRVLARRLVGSAFDTTFQLDGLRFPTSMGGAASAVDLTWRGYGIALAGLTPTNGLTGAVLIRPHLSLELRFDRAVSLDKGNTSPPFAVASTGGSNRSLAVWQQSKGAKRAVVARYYDGGRLQPRVRISPPGAGPTAAELGLDAQGDDAERQVVAFVQGGPSSRRIQVVAFSGG